MSDRVKEKRRYTASLRREQAGLTRSRIVDAARRLMAAGTYSTVTIGDVAIEAGVAYQTVYATFGTKQQLAQAVIDLGWPHVDAALGEIEVARASTDPRVWLRMVGRVTRRIYEPCADLVRFMRASGDPALLARYQRLEDERFRSFQDLTDQLHGGGHLRSDVTPSEATAVLWAMSSGDWYSQFVFQRGWTPDRYETWLGDALIRLLL